MTKLTGQNVTCVRGGHEIFTALDFEVGPGRALAVTGPNGAGKSSLLRVIAGLLPLISGTIHLDGEPELTLSEQAHYLGHRDALKATLSVRENLTFWKSFLGGETGDTDAALERVGLAAIDHLPAGFLSAGQRRRLSLARLLVVRRPLWLLDEPLTALDAASQIMLSAIMDAHLRGGGLIVAATHAPLAVPADELQLGAAA